MMKQHRGGTYEQCITDDNIISANIGLPNENTSNWANPRQTTTPDLWVYEDFPLEGLRGYTYEQATAGVQCPVVEGFQFPEVEDV